MTTRRDFKCSSLVRWFAFNLVLLNQSSSSAFVRWTNEVLFNQKFSFSRSFGWILGSTDRAAWRCWPDMHFQWKSVWRSFVEDEFQLLWWKLHGCCFTSNKKSFSMRSLFIFLHFAPNPLYPFETLWVRRLAYSSGSFLCICIIFL